MDDAPHAQVPDRADAVVIGAGHNGLIAAAYLARAGLRTVLVEARAGVGGTAASERFAGATVNICNCDHITFRTTPIMAELSLSDHGLRYVDVEPATTNTTWNADQAWRSHFDVDSTLDSINSVAPDDVAGYRRYVAAALPAVRMILEAANRPPTSRGLIRQAVGTKGRGVSTLLRWSRMSAADVMRRYFRSELVAAPGLVTGPMVWGISPELPGTGLGALTYAMRHAARVGRPVGGSGSLPDALQRAFIAFGGTLLCSTRVDSIDCQGDAVRGITVSGGHHIDAPLVVSACNPHDTFLRWLRHPPPSAARMVSRWSTNAHAEGYESKIDGVMTALPSLRALADQPAELALRGTVVVAPTIAEMHRGWQQLSTGTVLERPGLFVNVPTLVDPSMAPRGSHVLSLEALFTPYAIPGGWPSSAEPARWLRQLASLAEPGWLDTVGEWRAMTPDVYERDFHLPAGHATSFAGGPLAAFRNRNPELTRYATSVRGLYLTGAATFPGAGIWGASGRNAAMVALADHRH
jgi:beta-carotene ketolase (CrtO type)